MVQVHIPADTKAHRRPKESNRAGGNNSFLAFVQSLLFGKVNLTLVIVKCSVQVVTSSICISRKSFDTFLFHRRDYIFPAIIFQRQHRGFVGNALSNRRDNRQ